MAVYLSPVGGAGWQFFNNDGTVLSGGKLYTYSAGTTTPKATYTTSAGNIAHANPIILDSAGRTPQEIWLQTGYTYKFVIQTSAGVTLQTLDNLYPILQTSAATVNPFTAGMILIWSGSIGSIPTGWVLCNGSNGSPDLRDRFVIAAGSTYAVGGTGGSADAIVVTHTHTATVSDPTHTHLQTLSGGAGPDTGYNQTSSQTWSTTALGTTHATAGASTGISVSNASAGSSGTNANLPPYYALAYIMKT